MTERELHERYQAAIELAHQAGSRVMGFFQGEALEVRSKRDGSPVTAADRSAEEFLRGAIAARFPQDGVLGEEFGETRGSSGVRWVIDPIDGTKAFVCGVPLFGVLIGVEWDGEPNIGVIHAPALGETVHAAHGSGAVWERAGKAPTQARVSLISRLDEVVMCYTDRALFAREGAVERLQAIESKVKLTRGWSDCYAYMLLATGRVDVVIDPVMEVWDISPLVPIVRESGGIITNWRGESDPHARQCVATNGGLHAAVRAALYQG